MLNDVFAAVLPGAVIHCAGLKAVGESFADPLHYYEKNILGAVNVLRAMDVVGTSDHFSSSATVYGDPEYLPYDEQHRLAPENPYGRTKLFIEHLIHDWDKAGKNRSAVLLRYFNPIGAHPSGLIGEDPNDIPNNLMPYILDVAAGKRPDLKYLVMIIRRPTVPVFATTFMSRILPMVMSPLLDMQCATPASAHSISALGVAIPCWKS